MNRRMALAVSSRHVAEAHDATLRIAAFMLAIQRVLEVTTMRGVYS